MKTIKIKEDFRLPGTDVILEKGDKIQVKEDAHSAALEMIKDYMGDYDNDAYAIGLDCGDALRKAARKMGLNLNEFEDGLSG